MGLEVAECGSQWWAKGPHQSLRDSFSKGEATNLNGRCLVPSPLEKVPSLCEADEVPLSALNQLRAEDFFEFVFQLVLGRLCG
jgi:hypothetical protein